MTDAEHEDCILIVEDNAIVCRYINELLTVLGYEVCGTVDTADGAVKMAFERPPKAILMDVRLKGERDGIDAVAEIHSKMEVPVIFMTGSNEPVTLQRIRDANPAGLLIKPVLSHQLKSALELIV